MHLFPVFRLALALLLFITCTAAAQNSSKYTYYGVDEGLAQSTVSNITCDSDGFMWVGTSNGLCRFDGYSFKTYKHNPADSTTICNNHEHKFYVDKSGRMWVVTYGGISLYNSVKDNFTNIITYSSPYMISENCIYGEDSTYIWAGLCGYGLVKINKRTFKHTIVPLPVTTEMNDNYSSFKGFINGSKIYICRYTHVFVYDTKSGGINTMPLTILNMVNMNDSEALGVTYDGGILINKKTLAFRLITLQHDNNRIDATYLYRLSNTQAIICSTTRGLLFIDTHTGKIVQEIGSTGALPADKRPLYAKCVYKDRSGNTWIGTLSDGLIKLAAPFKPFKLYAAAAGNSTYSIYADSGNVYMGCFGTGLNIFSRKGGFIKNVSIKKSTGLLLNNVYSITPYSKNGLLMMGSSALKEHNNILFTYNTTTGQVQVLNNNNEFMLPNYWFKVAGQQFLTPSPGGRFLTGINEYLVGLTLTAAGRPAAAVINCFKNETVTCCFWHGDTLWTGTRSGAWVLHNGYWGKVNIPAGTEVKTICADNSGNMWVGTPQGIYVVSPANTILQHFTLQTGLADDHIYAILCDAAGNMWFSHNKGLSVYRLKQKAFEHFTKADGLQSSEFNSGAYFKAADGELFFGGVGGVTSFYPNEILDNPIQPIVKITAIKLLDQPYGGDTSSWKIQNIVLPYTDNSMSFNFTGLEFTDPAENRYAYTLHGVDKHWIDAGGVRFARYAGLQPGSYTFTVKATNNDGVWGEPVNISVYIAPPFWQRAWFRVTYGALFIGVIALVVTYVQKRKFKKQLAKLELQQRIQLERERISRDLHDNVGTQLSLMNRHMDDILQNGKTTTETEKNRKLQSARQQSSDVIDTLRETIWALSKTEITLEGFADQLKAFVQKQLEDDENIHAQFDENDANSTVVLSPAEVLNLFRICQEAVTNTIKYAAASVLNISIYAVSSKYCITITDNGKGFDPANVNKKFHAGLENMKYRANEIGSDLVINSKKGSGTSITLCKK